MFWVLRYTVTAGTVSSTKPITNTGFCEKVHGIVFYSSITFLCLGLDVEKLWVRPLTPWACSPYRIKSVFLLDSCRYVQPDNCVHQSSPGIFLWGSNSSSWMHFAYQGSFLRNISLYYPFRVLHFQPGQFGVDNWLGSKKVEFSVQ